MTHGPPQMAKLAEALGADPITGGLGRPGWRFWGFDVLHGDAEYQFPTHGGLSAFPIARHRIDGVADEIRRRTVSLSGGWRAAATAEIVGGWTKNARVLVWRPGNSTYGPDHVLPIYVSRRDDPLGWPLALGCLYHRTLEPLIDHVLESPLYAADHERVAAAWRAYADEIRTIVP